MDKISTFLILAIVAAGTTAIFIVPLCGILFKCGCVWIWAGSEQHCNIHHLAPPFCPWCSHGNSGFVLPATSLFLGEFVAGCFTLKLTKKMLLAILVTVVTIIPAAVVLGYITILVTSYPHFIM